ncbi:hypothetical protein [Actinomadura rudentiformis]|uniref:Uncharacterized protein n=1 Tax=Actinomadura rudentiformis TaxID=359158 RepID=A0A6H9YL70_9ACTN|nr:hypothetical protein [Actinomadura rudentiformis]KAB2341897.1 hypothetical protein F8566_40700 [Actinomadura rudentiformis]
MSTDRWELDRDAAERLLRGEPGDPGTPAEPLGQLLAAASTPAQERELAGEDAAVAAFTAAAATAAATATATSAAAGTGTAPLTAKRAHRIPLSRILTAKIAALSLAVTAAGGVALAAGTGTLPMGPLDNDPVTTVSPSPHPVSKTPSTGPSGTRTSPPPANGGVQPSALAALCRKYASVSAAQRAAALRSAAYLPLVSAAGGAPKVTGYCSKLLKPNGNTSKGKKPKNAKPSNQPSQGKSGENNGNQNKGNGQDKDDDGNPGKGDDKGNGNGNRGGKGRADPNRANTDQPSQNQPGVSDPVRS